MKILLMILIMILCSCGTIKPEAQYYRELNPDYTAELAVEGEDPKLMKVSIPMAIGVFVMVGVIIIASNVEK